jgi:hypothetical protein
LNPERSRRAFQDRVTTASLPARSTQPSSDLQFGRELEFAAHVRVLGIAEHLKSGKRREFSRNKSIAAIGI